jgi:hypothetical protein
MRLGITGTRKGMTRDQKFRVSQFLYYLKPEIINHGDAVGADAEFHDLAVELVNPWINVYPPDNPKYRANKKGDCIHTPLTYGVRDDNIIKDSDLMLATPFEYEERQRGSGTWMTIRHTEKFDKPLVIIWPDGTCKAERLDNLKKELTKNNLTLGF